MGYKWLLIIGLLITLLLLMALKKVSQWEQVIKKSEFKKLLPYIVAMARHETGDYTSELFVKANSLFGMKTFRHVTPFPSKEGGYYRVYSSTKESAEDLVKHFRIIGMPTEVSSAKEFVYELKMRKYFTDKEENYLRGIQKFLK